MALIQVINIGLAIKSSVHNQFDLVIAAKDLWRAGGEFITYLKSMGVNEIPVKVLS